MMLGVLGGMGPAAGAYFAYRLALLTDVDRDQDHLPVLLLNDPRIPDRSDATRRRGPSPLPAMRRNLQMLQASGCSCVAIPCNTAHYWYPELQMSATMPLLHIVTAVVDRLRAQGVPNGPVGLLGTPATIRSHLYQDELSAAGYTILPMSDRDVEQLCMSPIQAVKQNRLAEAGVALARALRELADRGASAVILASTDLPLARAAASQTGEGRFDVPVVDSIDALAISALKRFGFKVKGGSIAHTPTTQSFNPFGALTVHADSGEDEDGNNHFVLSDD